MYSLNDLLALQVSLNSEIKQYEELKEEQSTLKAKIRELEDIIQLYNLTISEDIDTKSYIENIITELLNTIFDDIELEYKLTPVEKEGLAIGLKETLLENGQEVEITSHGVKDGISLGYTLLTLSLKPELAQFLFIDEPAPHLNSSKIPKVIELLTDLSKLTGIQFACITHCNEAIGEKTYLVEKTKAGSSIKLV